MRRTVEHRGQATGAGSTRDEEVEAVRADVESVVERLQRPRLADRAYQRLDLGSARKREPSRIEPPPQLLSSQLETTAMRPSSRLDTLLYCHGAPSLAADAADAISAHPGVPCGLLRNDRAVVGT